MTQHSPGGPARLAASAVAIAALVAGCSSSPQPGASSSPPTASPSTPGAEAPVPVQPAGEVTVTAEGLDMPWAIVPLAQGGALVSERESALVREVLADGTVVDVGRVRDVAPAGEGGLLGLALLIHSTGDWVYAYTTTDVDNRVIRMPLSGEIGERSLGDPEVIIDGLPKARIHNGGRIEFGPDGMLYITVGDAAMPGIAQDRDALGGKILRLRPSGDIPADNPFSGSPVFSLGHRNPQGITWDGEGRMWASEFGQDTWDELNLIQPGGNYGWPEVEGIAENADFIDPVVQWRPAEASPSGIEWVEGTMFLASLRGQRIWALYPHADDSVDARPWFEGEFGRLRDTAPAPDGGLWFITNDTGNDRLLRVDLEPVA